MSATFTAKTYNDTDGIYLGVSKCSLSGGAFFTTEELRQLQKVISDALGD